MDGDALLSRKSKKNQLKTLLSPAVDGLDARHLKKWLRLRFLSLQYRYGWNISVYMAMSHASQYYTLGL